LIVIVLLKLVYKTKNTFVGYWI